MKISISTTFYKRGFDVERMYNQVLDQTHNDWEWIVTDDFSETDSAKEALLDICAKDPRVKYFEQSRKKEMYWNPQKGCSGTYVLQLDSDDYLYPKALEVYNHLFLKHPEVAGMSCISYIVDANDNWIEVQGGGHYNFEEHANFNFVPSAKIFKNYFPEFDNGELKWYQQDTNIVRHIETIGKWLYVPRVLYKYFYADTTISRQPGRTQEDFNDIERERLLIEDKFAHLKDPDKTTSLLYYLPVKEQSREFTCADFNLAKTRQKILYIKEGIKVYEKQLLKEIFFDHDLYFDASLPIKFDEIIISLNNPEILSNLETIKQILTVYNKGTFVKASLDIRNYPYIENVQQVLATAFGGWGVRSSGNEHFFNTAV